MGPVLSYWAIIAFLSILDIPHVAADTTTSFSYSCVPGSQVTAFPACNSFLGFFNTCPNLPSKQEERGCFCVQDSLNSLFNCESELRLCFEDNYFDADYEMYLSQWHSVCDTFLGSAVATLTTPPLSTPTANYDMACNPEACHTARILQDNCGYSFSNGGAPFTSCLCQPKWLVADYDCEFVGNTSCLGIPATLSNLLGYNCPNFQSVIGTGLPASQTVVTISASSKTSSSMRITPTPTITSPTASQTVKTTTSSVGNRTYCYGSLVYFFAFIIWEIL